MKPRKCFALLLLLCTLALLCTACASTTALDNIGTYYSEVGAVLDDWFASSSGGGVSGGVEGAVYTVKCALQQLYSQCRFVKHFVQ